MLTIKEAAEQLTSYGIVATEEVVVNWIDDGFLNAESDKIDPKALSDFIIRKNNELFNSQLEKSRRENIKLNEQIELLNTRLHIERSKVRTLKKLLNAQINASGADTSKYEEWLGLEGDPNNLVLKKEFKKLLKALHPDRGGDERLFKVFREHYENLK